MNDARREVSRNKLVEKSGLADKVNALEKSIVVTITQKSGLVKAECKGVRKKLSMHRLTWVETDQKKRMKK